MRHHTFMSQVDFNFNIAMHVSIEVCTHTTLFMEVFYSHYFSVQLGTQFFYIFESQENIYVYFNFSMKNILVTKKISSQSLSFFCSTYLIAVKNNSGKILVFLKIIKNVTYFRPIWSTTNISLLRYNHNYPVLHSTYFNVTY